MSAVNTSTAQPGPIIVVPARTGYGGFRLYDLRGESHPTGWYRDREMAQGVAKLLNAEAAQESSPPTTERIA